MGVFIFDQLKLRGRIKETVHATKEKSSDDRNDRILAAATGIKDKPRTLAHVKDFI
jgi:hypothetical protein